MKDKVLVQKARKVVHRQPAIYKTVKEKVLVSHGKSGWMRVSAPKGGC